MRTAYNPSRKMYTFHALTSPCSFIVIYSGKRKNWGMRLIVNCFTETSARRKIGYLRLIARNTAEMNVEAHLSLVYLKIYVDENKVLWSLYQTWQCHFVF